MADHGALIAITERDPELEAMETCFNLLEPLEPAAQDRVLKYIAIRLSGAVENAGAKEIVLAIIAREPGLRGNELVPKTKLKERTVRTALWRLKQANAIHQENGGWHQTRIPDNGSN